MDVVERKYYVYIHTRPDTGEYFYVGLGFGHRAYSRSGRNIYWKRIVAKNKGVYTTDIIKEGLTLNEAATLEIELIRKYGRKCFGEGILCNVTVGGEINTGGKHSPEQIAKMKLRCGEKHNMFGIPKPESVKQKIANTKRGVKQSEERKSRQSALLKEYYKTHPHHSKGLKRPQEIIDKCAAGTKRARLEGRMPKNYKTGIESPLSKGMILQYDKYTEVLLGSYGSLTEAQQATGIHSGRISAVITGKRRQAKGFIFKRAA